MDYVIAEKGRNFLRTDQLDITQSTDPDISPLQTARAVKDGKMPQSLYSIMTLHSFTLVTNLVTSNVGIARDFNEYFTSVFSVEDGKVIPAPVVVYDGTDTLAELRYSVPELVANLRNVDPSKAAGPVGFCPRCYKP